MTADVCFALTGDFRCNSRARRQVNALVASGLSVAVLHRPDPQTPDNDRQPPPGITLEAFTAATGAGGPRGFLQIHRDLTNHLAGRSFAVAHASDLYVLPALTRFAQERRTPVTLDARELYHHVAGTVGKPWARLFWHLLQKRYLPRVHAAFTVSDGIADRLAATYGIRRPIVVPNVALNRARESGADIRSDLGLPRDAFLAVHTGNIRRHRGCELAVEAAARFRGLHLAFVGSGQLQLELARMADAAGIGERVRFIRPVDPEDVTTFIRTADVGLALLEDVCLNHYLALPNKLFEYVAAGVPVIASALPEIARVVKDHDVGLCVEPSNLDALTDALRALESAPERRAAFRRNCAEASVPLSWEAHRQDFVAPFLDLVKK